MYFRTGKTKRTGFTAFELHHMYTGGLMALLCFWFQFEVYLPQWLATTLFWSGMFFSWIAVDDIVQHYVQGKQMRAVKYYDQYSFWNWFPRSVVDNGFFDTVVSMFTEWGGKDKFG